MENKDILNSSTHAGRNQYGSWALYEGNSAHIQNQKMTTVDASFSSKDSPEKLSNTIKLGRQKCKINCILPLLFTTSFNFLIQSVLSKKVMLL
jgi:hypothetical protein